MSTGLPDSAPPRHTAPRFPQLPTMYYLPGLTTAFALATALAAQAQIIPAPPQAQPVAITGATAHLGTGTAIEDAVVTFADGKITYAGAAAAAPDLAGHQVIDAGGKHVYPGFIAMDTRLGLVEIDAVRATDDIEEIGYFNPNARALIAFNTDSEILPTVRKYGVLIAQVTPDGNGLAGQSSAVALDGWNWEDAVVGADEGIHLHWPSAYRQTGWWAEPGGMEKNEDYAEDVGKLERYFDEARAYANAGEGADVEDNPRFRSMRPLFAREKTLYIHAEYAREIEDALAFATAYDVKPVLVDARDAFLVKELLAAEGVSVVCGPVHALPERGDDLVSQPFETPAELHAAGVPVAFSLSGSWEQRRLPYHAGHAVGFGMPYEEAVKALTLTPATILGIAERVGSLEAGKDATLFLSGGDALDMRGNLVERAFIAGRDVELASRQTQLAEKYREKYRRGE